MSIPRLLVLGGGSSQLSLLKRCRNLGFFTILADRNPKAPGRALCDTFEEASTFDAGAILAAASRRKADAILTAGTDQPVLVAARVAQKLGLPSFLDIETALAVTNKRVMKTRLCELGLPSADWVIVDKDFQAKELSKLSPPYVTKPVDSQGQRGVYCLPDIGAVMDVAEDVCSYSREDHFLVEEFYPGPEVTVSGWVARGETKILTITDRVTREFPPHIGVCFAHRYPSHLESKFQEISSLTRRIVEGFRIKEGPIYFQFLCGESGVFVNEISCRLGGAYEDLFIPRVTGIDLLDLLIRGSLGERVVPVPYSGFDPAVAPKRVSVPLMFCRPGRITGLSDLRRVRSLPGVVAAQWLQPEGTEIGQLVNSTARAAFLVVEAATRIDINNHVVKAIGKMSVRDEEDREMLLDAVVHATHPTPE